ncbi:MAG TPA: alkaline phosphatase family protein [Alphaproteobacteria bacterium]|jgi:arylsulfatase A-like enzyme|nr:alkaline phosphatase family protein [Alphaproteobacteria bacterium]
MAKARNILFIMCDQLRADYLSCLGHPSLQTPHIDALAARGVNFERAYVQSGVCGPSRMSFYTGRYMYSHGATWNGVPLSAREKTLGDYLRPAGLRVGLVGKTHVIGDDAALGRFGIESESERALLLRQGGFESVNRHEGHVAPPPQAAYQAYLKAQGYDCDDPWSDYVCAAEGPDGGLLSGWHMRNAHLPARVAERHSETAYSTDQAIQFINDQGERPWLLHLSYIKPHWPYLAPAPYHDMYGQKDCTPVVRSQAERDQPHPVTAAYFRHTESVSFARDEVINNVKPTYMGLVKQLDDHIGRLMAALEAAGRLDDTMIVFTSDHGDYLGDHWLGEKELFYEPSIRIPLIVYDPEAPESARGVLDSRFVESIDLVPTFLEALGVQAPSHLLEGRSLLPLLRGGEPPWREAVFCELDYAFRGARLTLGREVDECRAFMVRDTRWKYIHWQGYPAQLFDLENDPDELVDLGADPARAVIRAELHDRLFDWLASRKLRTTIGDDAIEARTASHESQGIYIGVW